MVTKKKFQNKHPLRHTHTHTHTQTNQPTNQPTKKKETLIGLNTNAMLCPFGRNID
jgi:hypothetical protein